jgi:hypothetical protein
VNLEETADFISEGLPEWQRNANLEFLEQIHNTVKVGGMWAYPAACLVFTVTEEGFELDIPID